MAQRNTPDPIAIRLAELQEAILCRAAIEVMLERNITAAEAVDTVMNVMERIVQEKRESRQFP